MATLSLKADTRNLEEKVSHIRKSKKIPAVVYGKKTDSQSIQVEYSDFLRTYRQAWESNIISLSIWKETLDVLVYYVQKAPVTWDFIHVDFYAITRGEALTTNIHFNFVGESAGAREGWILEEMMKEIEVKCLPRNLVDHFDVDLSKLTEIGSMIKVGDLGIDTEKYDLSNDLEDVIAKVSAPRVEEEAVNMDDIAVTWAEPKESAEWNKKEK
jgi:large subunit ribosomal protein L25